MIIGANPKKGKGRGVVSTCSYEARAYGIHSGMPISKAYHLCPHGVYLPSDREKYYPASELIMEFLHSLTDQFQQTSIDEAYLDVTALCPTLKHAGFLAQKIQDTIKSLTGITASIGVGPTKVVAKIACNANKPNGLTIITPSTIKSFLAPLKITEIPGIGKKTKSVFHERNIYTIGDLYRLSQEMLENYFGRLGRYVYKVLEGIDNEKIGEKQERKSMGKEKTFGQDVGDPYIIKQKIAELCAYLHQKMRERYLLYKTIELKIRFSDFSTYTRSFSFGNPVHDKELANRQLNRLLLEFYQIKKKVRLVGVRFSSFSTSKAVHEKSLDAYVPEAEECDPHYRYSWPSIRTNLIHYVN